ncbi:family 16 glycosylhydrolase [Pedobacter sp. HDW13]|uniref:family 16 glycosylhydrolase n=1 Tax=Pedobacter sp. HDW13 TaxID=2714940 RepID=UPI00140C8A91|nr:family 16 glycosylhydrolase [Pedobacter sp. HDW13]QIL38340.1 family 16 glycosylhydrolase [Pedobacter sp. HDW13]
MKQKMQPSLWLASLAILAMTSCRKNENIGDLETEKLIRPEAISAVSSVAATPTFIQMWGDEFNSSGSFNASNWAYAQNDGSPWSSYLISNPNYAYQDGSNLVLRMDNATVAGNSQPYHAGGVTSRGKINLKYGRIEVRAKMKEGQGSWPAIWLLPEPATQHGPNPDGGEIDLMEHVNNENVVWHSLHRNNGSSSTSYGHVKNDYNIYRLDWTPTSIKMYTNNVLAYTYNKTVGGDWRQWPFDRPFYIILNQSGGLGWPGPITNSQLPFTMHVDYIRVYKLTQAVNGSFETASLSPWTAWQPVGGGTVSVVASNARSGSRAVSLQGGQTSVEQTITGLQPNTTYVFGGYAKLASTALGASMGVKGYGGANLEQAITTTSYQQKLITFTTGSTNTSATIFLYKSAVNGTVYGDDFYLETQ